MNPPRAASRLLLWLPAPSSSITSAPPVVRQPPAPAAPPAKKEDVDFFSEFGV